jgi:hypothetical protein
MKYPAASGRGIRIKKDSIAYLGITLSTRSLNFERAVQSPLHFYFCERGWQKSIAPKLSAPQLPFQIGVMTTTALFHDILKKSSL